MLSTAHIVCKFFFGDHIIPILSAKQKTVKNNRSNGQNCHHFLKPP